MRQSIVTGPTGAVGMALLGRLLEEKLAVAAVVRPGSSRKERILKAFGGNPLLTLVECGLDELGSLSGKLTDSGFAIGSRENRMQGFVFYHLGWDGTFGNSRNNMYGQNCNVKYALDAVAAAADCGCDTWIGTGSQAEYGRVEGSLNALTPPFPENGYGMAKLCAGQMTRVMAKDAGLRHIWTRILSVYGPYDGENTMVMSTIRALLAGERPACTKGEQQWDYLYSGDAGRALYLLGQSGRDGKVYCIGSGKVRSLREYIEQIRDEADSSAQIGFGEIPYSDRQVFHLCADISELTKDTGFVPEVSFADGIRATIAYAAGQQD